MLVVLIIVVGIVIVVVVAVFIIMLVVMLHMPRPAAISLDGHAGACRHRRHCLAGTADRVQPFRFVAYAIQQQQIGIGNARQVAGGGLEAVRVGAAGYQRSNICLLPGDLAHYIR